MKIEQLRDMSGAELVQKLKDLKSGQFQQRFKRITGDVGDPSKFRKLRRDIARIKTILKEREIYETWKKSQESA